MSHRKDRLLPEYNLFMTNRSSFYSKDFADILVRLYGKTFGCILFVSACRHLQCLARTNIGSHVRPVPFVTRDYGSAQGFHQLLHRLGYSNDDIRSRPLTSMRDLDLGMDHDTPLVCGFLQSHRGGLLLPSSPRDLPYGPVFSGCEVLALHADLFTEESLHEKFLSFHEPA